MNSSPFLGLLQDVAAVGRDIREVDAGSERSKTPKPNVATNFLREKPPKSVCLGKVLEATEIYWGLWPIGPSGPTIFERPRASGVPHAKDFLVDSFNSDDASSISKAFI